MNFKQLGEKKRQIEQSLKIGKAIENLVIHSTNNDIECFIDYQFVVSDFHIKGRHNYQYEGDISELEKDILDCINKAIQNMQLEIMKRTNEVLNTRPKGR